ncbi:cation-translocating P-type ATPase C-terminal domain-containing protein [Streptomyces sp. DSM 40750]|uniref:cation-translocating P-type ATPase C-terminal domain-containing protein n=1 Tax=Streptomyces sp. DSM 40750 TaxID=2801030 RepID=UPI00214BBC30|nr:cation-translocating P-type ATPase C-terminal domain-containing protein [Streptomyces sp. DSM 40750]UUU21463.1 cation-translocating P-type ATPase C-terminal domain-containing protein [Streptomyces sp. DSM 40750]
MARSARWAEEGAWVLLVVRAGTPVAVAGLVPRLHALAHHLVRAAGECGQVRLVGGPPGPHRRFGLPEPLPTGHARTAALVRSLQAEGHGVAVVSARTRRAPARADLGTGVITGPRHVPCDAYVAARPDVVHVLLMALPEARRVGLPPVWRASARSRAGLSASSSRVRGLDAGPSGDRHGHGRGDTVALVSLVSSQLLQTLADAGRDPVVAAAVVGSLVALAVAVTVPGLSPFFGSRPLGPMGWTIALASAAGSVVLPAAVRGAVPEKRIPEIGSSPSGNLGAASRKP